MEPYFGMKNIYIISEVEMLNTVWLIFFSVSGATGRSNKRSQNIVAWQVSETTNYGFKGELNSKTNLFLFESFGIVD